VLCNLTMVYNFTLRFCRVESLFKSFSSLKCKPIQCLVFKYISSVSLYFIGYELPLIVNWKLKLKDKMSMMMRHMP